MRQRQTAANRPILSCQAADIAEGLAFDHCPYNAIIDKVSRHTNGRQRAWSQAACHRAGYPVAESAGMTAACRCHVAASSCPAQSATIVHLQLPRIPCAVRTA